MVRAGGGDLVAQARLVQDFRNLSLRFLVVVDVAGFSQRHTAEQSAVQSDLERAMSRAAAAAGLDRDQWYRQPTGDGELAVLPAGADGLSLVADYPRRLAAAIAAVNRSKPIPRLRVRLAIHHGGVAPGTFGPVGAVIVVSRLADADIVRRQLRQRSDIDLALIVSATVYDEVIQSRLSGLRPDAFRRVVTRPKGASYVGYLYEPPLRPPARRGEDRETGKILPAGLSIVGAGVRDHDEEPAGEPAVTEGKPA